MFFGLNLRQLLCAILAAGAAVGIYFGLRDPLGTETVSWLCILGAAPFAAVGFIKYNSMTAEKFIATWVKSEILMPRHLSFKAENIYYSALSDLLTRRRTASIAFARGKRNSTRTIANTVDASEKKEEPHD